MLGSPGLLDEAHAAVYLHPEAGYFATHIGGVGLCQRRQEINPLLGAARPEMGPVEFTHSRVDQRTNGLCLRLHPHDHAPYIGMFDNGNGARRGVARAGALNAITRIADSLLRGPLGNLHALQPDVQTRVVHHGEHGPHPPELGADEPPTASIVVTERHDTGWGRMNTQLVLDGCARNVVAAPVGQEFGHQEQRDAARASRCVRCSGKHQMNDVFGKIMFAEGDEDLAALDQPAAVFGRRCCRTQGADIRTGLRFGKIHRAGPFTRHQLRQIGPLQLWRTMGRDRFDRPLRQHGRQSERHVGGANAFRHAKCDRIGKALPAKFGRSSQGSPAAIDISTICCPETGRHRDGALGQGRRIIVSDAIEGRPLTGCKRCSAFKDCMHQIGFCGLEARVSGQIGQTRDMLENEVLLRYRR